VNAVTEDIEQPGDKQGFVHVFADEDAVWR